MALVLDRAKSGISIAECEWAAAPLIRFAYFTSCIGIVAKQRNTASVVGIHLVIDKFAATAADTDADVREVLRVLKEAEYQPDTVRIVGCLGMWELGKPVAFAALRTALGNPSDDDCRSSGLREKWGAQVVGGNLVFQYWGAEYKGDNNQIISDGSGNRIVPP